jgi:predicted HicB family RNase H-like nuclease
LDRSEELALSIDQECLQRLGLKAYAEGVSLDDLVNGILREALSKLEESLEN